MEADAETYQVEENEFDAIYCLFAIVLFTNIPAILRNWHHFLNRLD